MSGTGARVCLVLLFAVWAGIVIGVSFIATPAKFGAPSLSIAVAVDVGRHTFRALGWVELGIAAAASVLCWLTRPKSGAITGLVAIWLVILVEWLWLLPVLDQRVNWYLSGSLPNVSYHHSLFIGFEALKVAILLICAAFGAYRLSAQWR